MSKIEPELGETSIAPPPPVAETDARARERTGRRWLLWSILVCPCHLPLTMGVLGAIFGGTAFGALVARNAITVGVVFGILYVIGLAIGFRHLRAATAGYDCSGDSCEVEDHRWAG